MTSDPPRRNCCIPEQATVRAAKPPVFDCRFAAQPALWRIEACTFMMGSHGPLAHPLDGEGPVRAIELDAFEISATAVTISEFTRFVSETSYATEA